MIYTYIADYAPEGAGSMLQREIYAYLLSLLDNASFARSPFQIDYKHETNVEAMHLSNFAWNGFFEFMNNHKAATDILTQACNKYCNISFTESTNRIEHLSPKTWHNCIHDFRAYFQKHNLGRMQNIRSKNERVTQISLHIRNYSAADTQIGLGSLPWEIFTVDYREFSVPLNNPMYYSNFYVSLILKIISTYKICRESVNINIFSTGNKDDFSFLIYQLKTKNIPVRLNLNNPSYQDFLELISSDYLIMAKSSFSYIAALCSTSPKFIRHGFRLRLPYDVVCIKDDIALRI